MRRRSHGRLWDTFRVLWGEALTPPLPKVHVRDELMSLIDINRQPDQAKKPNTNSPRIKKREKWSDYLCPK